ncbi:MAG: glycoside hydrolase family 2 TIM barrel-domain containing protein [Thermoleophilaceae bacterium]
MRLALASGLAASLAAAALAAAPAGAVFTPPEKAVTVDGATGRFLLDGTWRMRRDKDIHGVAAGWATQTTTKGWKKVTVPNAWNAHNFSPKSMGGGVTWYRKDFKLPQSGSKYDWLVRFESIRYRASVWVNGHEIGGHTGAYLPFELQLRSLSRKGVNRLVIRVDNRQRDTDLPPGSLTTEGLPNGGWWNYGGLLGDVYLRRVDQIDIQDVRVLPHLDCASCDAQMEYRATVKNYSDHSAPVKLTSKFGDQDVDLGEHTIGAGDSEEIRGTTTIASPHLWSPSDPFLYQVSLSASGAGGSAGWTLESGIRSIAVQNGRLTLNGRGVNFRGGFFHEDSLKKGGAADHARMQLVIDRLKQIGGTVLRTHYPLDPYFHQLADREGVFIWSEIPVYQVEPETMKIPSFRKSALREMRENILDNASHPSVLTWSMANELAAEPGSGERKYFRDQSKNIRSLDPTRPVSLVILGYPYAGCQRSAYKPVDMLGVNTYFGWYEGPNGSIADRRQLSPYLDALRKCYPDKAIANTEFGAEANRKGPAEERGTYAFQKNYVNYTLGVYAKKPWISGAIGMLMAFRCRPNWDGGNPRPTPPIHEKGVFDLNGDPKPAAAVMSDWYHRTQQYDLPAP